MKKVKMAICGRPLSGKSTIVRQLLDIANGKGWETRQSMVSVSDADFFVRALMSNGRMDIEISYTKGAIFYQEDVFEKILEDVDIVIYVVVPSESAVYGGTIGDYTEEEMIEHRDKHEAETAAIYFKAAQKRGLGIDECPWIFVMNLCDQGSSSKLFRDLETKYGRLELHRTTAITGEGVPEVFNRLLQLAQDTNTE